jgi:hypothetical protein
VALLAALAITPSVARADDAATKKPATAGAKPSSLLPSKGSAKQEKTTAKPSTDAKAKPQDASDSDKKSDTKSDAKADAPKTDAAQSDAAKTDAKSDEKKVEPKKDAPAEGTVLVHLDSPTPVALEAEETPNSESFHQVCTSPCDQRLPVGTRYRVVAQAENDADDLRPSKPFWLDTQKDSLTLKVDPQTKKDFRNGLIVAGSGGAVFLGGVVTLIVGLANRNDPQGIDGTVTDRTYSDTMWVGTTLMVVGLAVGAYGGSMLWNSRHTTVNGGVQAPPPAKGQGPSQTRQAFAMPATQTFQILGGSF